MIFSNFDPKKIRKDFPILQKDIIYLDSACMSLKPQQVIDKILEYYTEYSSCAGRSAHKLSTILTEKIQEARQEVAKLLTANPREIIFTRNTTEGINLIANSLNFQKNDEIIITDKEHNSNLIPWLKLKKEKGIKLKVCESNKDNTFNLDNFKGLLTEDTKLVSIVHVSNLDGVENPIKEITNIAHKNNSLVLIDGAQSVPHQEVNTKKLDIDFLSFSGHKMLGPTGTGVLYGKLTLLENLNQFIVGGQTVIDSTYNSYTPEEIPARFEAGLQDYAGIIGFGEACKYLRNIGLSKIKKHVESLNTLLTNELKDEPKIEIIGPLDPKKRGGVFSFNIKDMDPHHVSRILSTGSNIMTRSGAHCVHSWFNKHKMKGSARASLYLYNTEEEIQKLAEEIKKIISLS